MVVAFGSIGGFGIAVWPSALKRATFTLAMWTVRSPNVCCASVGRKPYLSAGISSASLCIVVFNADQSFNSSTCSDTVCVCARVAPNSAMAPNVNTTIVGVNEALGQVHTTLDGVNLQLAKVDTITGHAQSVTANVANLATVVAAAAANPLVKVAAFGYGVRRAASARRHADEEREVRTTLRQQRKAARAARKAGQVTG